MTDPATTPTAAVDDRWQSFFTHPDYLWFARTTLPEERTATEVAAVRRMLNLRRGTRVLDLGCGYGRIGVPLARQGSVVTGLDAVPGLLEQARRAAREAGVHLELILSEMRNLDAVERFDAVVNLSTALGYVADENEDAEAIAAAYRALVPGGRLLIDTENREAMLRTARRVWFDMGGMTVWCRRSFDPMNGRWSETVSWLRDGVQDSATYSLRLYSLTELRALLERAGFVVEEVWGDFTQAAYGCDSPRMIVRARRPE
ncbi:class I SAM-dependent methyltransferase [Actinomadura sp. 3N407]|uniref:class I SAM-dependent methyltransferase n=1 Tax=Actinomadura sp. 3N407 TaxID=3457423 RepID=UPI003FCE5B78